jgi:hypothetical protein
MNIIWSNFKKYDTKNKFLGESPNNNTANILTMQNLMQEDRYAVRFIVLILLRSSLLKNEITRFKLMFRRVEDKNADCAKYSGLVAITSERVLTCHVVFRLVFWRC